MSHYSDPVSRLLSLDEPKRNQWLNYIETFGFSAEHIPELVRMASDPDLQMADQNSPEVWAPLHAWRTLGQLRAEQAVPELLSILEKLPDDDWAHDDIPVVCGMIGAAAIEPVRRFLNIDHADCFINITAANCLHQIASSHADLQEVCVQALIERLQRFQDNDEALNGFLISYLIDVDINAGRDHLALIEQAFLADKVDEMVLGDFEDVQITLGLLKKRKTRRPNYFTQRYPDAKNFADTLAALTATDYETSKSAIKHAEFADEHHSLQKSKIGRNDPCPCGSGKKYKKCCLH